MKKTNRLLTGQVLATAIFCMVLNASSYAQQEPLTRQTSAISGSNSADITPQYTREDLPVPSPSHPQEFIENEVEEVEPNSQLTMPPEAQAAAQAMVERIDAYKLCVRGVIASDSPVSAKREEIDTECGTQRQQIADTLPQDLQEFMLLNMDRRINLVLRTMGETEGVVDSTLEDITEAVDELSTGDNP
jgi:hypothetical protein